jgi:YesN/AraC family two-component response regulator
MLNVLVVDDEADVQHLFKQYFRRDIRAGAIGFRFAFSGEEALSILEEQPASVVLVLSDINMPGMTGLDLLRSIKQHYAAVKVIMITAYGDEEKHTRAMRYGADGYLTKPIDFDELNETMRRFR